MNFKEICELLAIMYANRLISDEEFLELYEAHLSKNLELPYKENGKFDLQAVNDDECKEEFHFSKCNIPLLVQVVGIPDYMWGPQDACFSVLRVFIYC